MYNIEEFAMENRLVDKGCCDHLVCASTQVVRNTSKITDLPLRACFIVVVYKKGRRTVQTQDFLGQATLTIF